MKSDVDKMEPVAEEPELEDEGYHTGTKVDFNKKVKFTLLHCLVTWLILH